MIPSEIAMKKAFTQTIVSTALLGIAAALTGCASGVGSTAADKEQIVERRAQERLNHLKDKSYTQAYAYLAPSYRAVVSAENYGNRFSSGATWADVVVKGVKCETEERCTVNVDLKVLVLARGFGGKPIAANLVETWLKEDGQWWFYQKD